MQYIVACMHAESGVASHFHSWYGDVDSSTNLYEQGMYYSRDWHRFSCSLVRQAVVVVCLVCMHIYCPCVLQVEPELIELSEEMACDSYKPSSFKFLSDGAPVSNFPVCQVSNAPNGLQTAVLSLCAPCRAPLTVSQHCDP